MDGKYYVKEIYAPAGFVTTDEIKEFTFEYQGEDTAEVSYHKERLNNRERTAGSKTPGD